MVLPTLGESDYLHMLEATVALVLPYLRKTFEQIGLEMIQAALDMRQGCRFLEDVMLQTLLTERALVRISHSDQLEFPLDRREAKQIESNASDF